MARWRYKIELSRVLAEVGEKFDLERVEENCPEECKEALAKEVSKAWPLRGFADDIRSAKSIAAVNRILARVYDEADRMLVWCGMPSFS